MSEDKPLNNNMYIRIITSLLIFFYSWIMRLPSLLMFIEINRIFRGNNRIRTYICITLFKIDALIALMLPLTPCCLKK